jgi:hypothetical protein
VPPVTMPPVTMPPVTVPPVTVPPPVLDVPAACKSGPGAWDIKPSSSATKQLPGGSITVTVSPCVAFRGESFHYTASISGPYQARFGAVDSSPVEIVPFVYPDLASTAGWDLSSATWTCGGPMFVPQEQSVPAQDWTGTTIYRGVMSGTGLQTVRVLSQWWWLNYNDAALPGITQPPGWNYVCVANTEEDLHFDLPVITIDADRPPNLPIS